MMERQHFSNGRRWIHGLRVPMVAAPMFLVSGPELLLACCRAGIVGTLPAHNARSTDQLAAWLQGFGESLAADAAPHAVNLITHRSNPRFEEDLEAIAAHHTPMVITSVGAPGRALDAVHRYGGLVFSDVATVEHARKASGAGVDGLILLCAGAGGNTGSLNPFAFLEAVRAFHNGLVMVAGGITNGAQIHALEILGCDLAYVGTPFIVAKESLASDGYRRAVVAAQAADVICTAAVSGIPANVLSASLEGVELPALAGPMGDLDVGRSGWLRHIWGAGHGVGAVGTIEPAAGIVERFSIQYETVRRARAGETHA